MNLTQKLYLPLLIVFLCISQSALASKDGLGFKLNYDAKGSYWFTSDDDDSEEGVGHALDYKPELIVNQQIQGDILWRHSSVFQIKYETSLTGRDTYQEELLEISDKQSAFEKLETFVDLVFLATGENPMRDFFGHIRFDYKQHQFFGNASVQETTDFITDDSNRLLNPGDNIRFRSDFEEISLTWRIKNFRIGAYQTETRKPHETSISGQNNIVIDTKISGMGLKIIKESATSIFDFNLGVVKFRGDQNRFRSDGYELLIYSAWQPHIAIVGSTKPSNSLYMAIVPFISGQFSMQYGGEAEGYETFFSELAMDIIVDAGIGVVIQI